MYPQTTICIDPPDRHSGLRLPTATPASLDGFVTRSRLKSHHIQAYRTEPGLETMIRTLKSVEHHLRLGGGSGQNIGAEHLSVAWTHLDNVLDYPWSVS